MTSSAEPGTCHYGLPATWSVHFDINSNGIGEALAAGGLDPVDLGGEDLADARRPRRASRHLPGLDAVVANAGARRAWLMYLSPAAGRRPETLRRDGSVGDSRNA